MITDKDIEDESNLILENIRKFKMPIDGSLSVKAQMFLCMYYNAVTNNTINWLSDKHELSEEDWEELVPAMEDFFEKINDAHKKLGDE